jgi:hypothetical protein
MREGIARLGGDTNTFKMLSTSYHGGEVKVK